MTLKSTPISLTRPAVALPISYFQHQGANSNNRFVKFMLKEAIPRVFALITTTALQIIDLISNLLVGVVKLILLPLNLRNITHFGSLDFSPKALLSHFKKAAFNLLGVATGSIVGSVNPNYVVNFLTGNEMSWKYAKSPIGFNTFYEKGLLLNMEKRRKDRYEPLQHHLKAVDCQVGETPGEEKITRFNAIDASDDNQLRAALSELGINKSLDAIAGSGEQMRGRNAGHRKGRLACYLGHLKMLSALRGNENAVVMEDDLRFYVNAPDVLAHVKEEIKDQEYDIFYPSVVHKKPPKKIPGKRYLAECSDVRCTHVYVVRGKEEVFDNLIGFLKNHIESSSDILPVDDAMAKYYSEGYNGYKPRVLCCTPSIAGQTEAVSDIEGHVGAGRDI
ncbi:MAG: hypothetical protein MRY21_06360 [Simkaniaceae bacterium]|nr:hypothetical protein [Simkaniaceae bacterium]